MQLNQINQTTEQSPTPGDVKSQGVRLMDIAVFGPMMLMSVLGKKPPGWLRLAMVGVGVGTILYNARNYLMVEKDLKQPADSGNVDLR